MTKRAHATSNASTSSRPSQWAGAPAARALTGEVLTRVVRGEQAPQLAAMAKNTATDMCSYVCDQAVQLHGGYGYMREYPVERLYRDARLYPLGGGTREIMNEIIAKTRRY